MIKGSRIGLNGWQQAAVAVGSAVGALLDPRRADLIAALGETTGTPAFHRLLHRMKASPQGKVINCPFHLFTSFVSPFKCFLIPSFFVLLLRKYYRSAPVFSLKMWGMHGIYQQILLELHMHALWDPGTSPQMIGHLCGSWKLMSWPMSLRVRVRCMIFGTPCLTSPPIWLVSPRWRSLSLNKCYFPCVSCLLLEERQGSVKNKDHCSIGIIFRGPSVQVWAAQISCVYTMSDTFMKIWLMFGRDGGSFLLLHLLNIMSALALTVHHVFNCIH